MTNFYRVFTLILGVLLLVITVSAAQDTPPTMHTLLSDLQARDTRVTFEFAAPLTTNVHAIDVKGSEFKLGEDYVCFGEVWNQGTRQRCTPFSNIASVTFVE